MDSTVKIPQILGGIFCFCFGLPFTLVPFIMFFDGAMDPAYPFEALFMIAFSLPFLLIGLAIQSMGLAAIRWAFVATKDPTLAPRLGKIGPARIAITEHANPNFVGEYIRQSEIINGRDWYRMADGNSRLYYYAVNEGGAPGWAIDDRQDNGSKDWFNGGWFPSTVATLPLGRRKWNDIEPPWVEIEVLESAEKKSNWWEKKS